MRDGALAQIQGPSHDIQAARAYVAHKSEDVENVAAVRPIDASLHRQPEQKHDRNRTHDQQPSNPALLNQVPGARDEPANRRCDHGHGGHRLSWCGFFSGRGICHSDDYKLALNFTCDFSCLRPHQNVDFTAYTEFRQIDARFDRKTGVGQNATLIVNFQVVHVGAVGMHFGSDGMPSAMDKVIAEARFFDVISSGPIYFPPAHVASAADAFLNHFHSGVARVANYSENFLHSS